MAKRYVDLMCFVCARIGGVRNGVCQGCRAAAVPAADRFVSGAGVFPPGLVVKAPFVHEGPARVAVHRVKYSGLVTAVRWLAAAMASCIPPGTDCLVPIPRATLRRWRHGIDPARLLAMAVAASSGLPVVAGLGPAWWWPARAGHNVATARRWFEPGFRPQREIPGHEVMLVDDVVTTGRTALLAARTLSEAAVPSSDLTIGLLTATTASRVPWRAFSRKSDVD